MRRQNRPRGSGRQEAAEGPPEPGVLEEEGQLTGWPTAQSYPRLAVTDYILSLFPQVSWGSFDRHWPVACSSVLGLRSGGLQIKSAGSPKNFRNPEFLFCFPEALLPSGTLKYSERLCQPLPEQPQLSPAQQRCIWGLLCARPWPRGAERWTRMAQTLPWRFRPKRGLAPRALRTWRPITSFSRKSCVVFSWFGLPAAPCRER